MMKVKCIKNEGAFDLVLGQIYNVLSVEKNWYRIIDESGEDYIYPPEMFEVV